MPERNNNFFVLKMTAQTRNWSMWFGALDRLTDINSCFSHWQ